MKTLGSVARFQLGMVVWVCLAGMAAVQQQESLDKPAAVVNGIPITVAEVEAALKRQGPTPILLSEERRREMRRGAVEKLIEDQLVQQFLLKHAPQIEPGLVDRRLADLLEELKKQGQTLADYCRETGQSEAQVRAGLANALQWQAFVNSRVTALEMKRYYEDNRDFFDGTVVRVSHIELHVPSNASAAELTAAQNKLLALRQEIITGKLDFAEAARKNSQSSSAKDGGDIGYIQRKLEVEEPFARAAFALKVGEVSEVVRTEQGVHLIKVTERQPGEPSDFQKIQDEVLGMCALELRMAVIAEQRRTAKIELYLP